MTWFYDFIKSKYKKIALLIIRRSIYATVLFLIDLFCFCKTIASKMLAVFRFQVKNLKEFTWLVYAWTGRGDYKNIDKNIVIV